MMRHFPILLGSLVGVTALAAGATASEVRTLPVPAVTLYPGDAVTSGVLTGKNFRMPEGADRKFATKHTQLEGKFARRTLVAGRPISLMSLRNEETVQRGVPSRAVYTEDGLTISTTLMPLQSGETGQTIQARNIDTGRIVRAEVSADGSLRISQP